MVARKLIEWRGRSKTVDGWADELGISPETLRYRLGHSGMTPEEAFTKPTGRRPATQYEEVHAAARRLGLKFVTVMERIRNGESMQSALSRPRAYRETDSEHCEATRALAKEYGVTRQRIEQIGDAAASKLLREMISARIVAWEAEGNALSVDEAADVVVLVATDPGIRTAVFHGDLDVGALCKARIAMRRVELRLVKS